MNLMVRVMRIIVVVVVDTLMDCDRVPEGTPQ